MDSSTLWVLLCLCWTIMYFLLRRDPKLVKYYKNFDGPSTLPFIGSLHWVLVPVIEMAPLTLKFGKMFGKSFAFWFGNIPYVSLQNASQIEKVLAGTTHLEKPSEYDMLQNWLGGGLVFAKPDNWKIRRKLLNGAFHFNSLVKFMDTFNEQGEILMDLMEQKADGQPFDIFPYMTNCTLDIIAETAMGTKLDAQKLNETSNAREYVKAVYQYTELMAQKLLCPWLRINLICEILGNGKRERMHLKKLHSFTEKVIQDRKEQRRALKANADAEYQNQKNDLLVEKKSNALLDILLDAAEHDSSITDEEIRNEVDTFMFAGHDDSAANLAWTVLLLALYKNEQEKVQMELDEIFKNEDVNLAKNITSTELARMTYLECCIKESLRLYPSLPGFMRKLAQDCDLGQGQVLPKGATVIINALLLHRDPDVFPDPETFDPSRFFPENCGGRHPYAYTPFAAGPRNCIGHKFAMLEEKVILAKLLLNYNFEAVAKSREEVRMLPDIILRPYGGVHVKITRRRNK